MHLCKASNYIYNANCCKLWQHFCEGFDSEEGNLKSIYIVIILNGILLGLIAYLGIGGPSLWKKMFIQDGIISWPWFFVNLLILVCLFSFVVTSISLYLRNAPQSSNGSDIFKVNFITIMRFKWPGSLLVLNKFPSGKTLSPVSIALWLEVSNNRQTLSRVYSYDARALFRYDEGGKGHLVRTKEGDSKYRYEPSGKVVEKWRKLYSMGYLHDQVYFITNKGFNRCRRLDFSENSFDSLSRSKQLRPGESMIGWIFFEIDQDLRGQLPEIKELELALRNSAGEEQTFRTQNIEPPGSAKAMTHLSGAEWNLIEGEYDLTKEQYVMTAMVDLNLPLGIKGSDDDLTPPRSIPSESEQ